MNAQSSQNLRLAHKYEGTFFDVGTLIYTMENDTQNMMQ